MNKEVWVPRRLILTIMQETHISEVKWSLAQSATEDSPSPAQAHILQMSALSLKNAAYH